jgi:CBS domain containing-hemolysin-like protein
MIYLYKIKMTVYKIDAMGIKTSVFTIIISCFAVFYFGSSTVFLRFCKTKTIGGSKRTLDYSYAMNIIALLLSMIIFLYTFVMAYFFKRLLSNTTYNSNMYKVIGIFIFALFLMVIVFINAQIFDTARKASGLDSAEEELLLGMLVYSLLAGLFVLFYMFYYVYNNVLRFNTHFKNIVLKMEKKMKNPSSSTLSMSQGTREEENTSDDEVASVANLNKFRQLALKKKTIPTQEVDPFTDDLEVFE